MPDAIADTVVAVGLPPSVAGDVQSALAGDCVLQLVAHDAALAEALGTVDCTVVVAAPSGPDPQAAVERLRAQIGARAMLLLTTAPTAATMAAARRGGHADWLAPERVAADGPTRLAALRAMSRADRETAAVAGGLAHDLNTLLGGLMGASAMLPPSATTDPAIQSFVARVDAAAARGAGLVAALSAYTASPAEADPLAAYAAMQAAIDAVRGSLPSDVTVVLDDPTTTADAPAALQPLAQNLLLAGATQLPRGGALHLSLRDDAATGWSVEVTGHPTASSGGFRDANPLRSARSTEPTGLGWVLASQIAARHGGLVRHSRDAASLRLTATIRPAPADTSSDAAPAPSSPSAAHVLLVTPHDLERGILRDMLALVGVATVTDGSADSLIRGTAAVPDADAALLCLEPHDPDLAAAVRPLREAGLRVVLLSAAEPPSSVVDHWTPRPASVHELLRAFAG